MKNQFRTMTVLALVSTMVLASCSKGDGGDVTAPAGNFSVNLSFKNARTTRAEGSAAVKGTKITIEDGYLCFATSTGIITDVYTISDSPTSGKNISKSGLTTATTTLQNVPGSSHKVYMIANKGTLSAVPAVGNNMSTYLNNTMDVTDQSDYTKVTCMDEATLTDAGENKKSAAIELATNVSRIQIKGLTFDGFTSGKVAGVFINGFYSAMELDGGADDLKTSVDKTQYVAGSTVFTTPLQSYVYDTFDKNIAASVTPSGVWGYNLFASTTPQIIIKLTDVVAGVHTYDVPQFITVNGFKNATTSAQIDNLEGGMIYTIEVAALVIKPEHLNPEPGVTPFAVDVTIEQAEWDETTVVPSL